MTVPSFEDVPIVRVSLGNVLHVLLGNKWEFSLAGTLFLTHAGQATEEVHRIYDADPVESPPQLAFLIGKRITEVVVAEGGHLAINVDGAQVSLRADPRYEAWQLHGPKGELLLCGVDGEMTTWGARRE